MFNNIFIFLVLCYALNINVKMPFDFKLHKLILKVNLTLFFHFMIKGWLTKIGQNLFFCSFTLTFCVERSRLKKEQITFCR